MTPEQHDTLTLALARLVLKIGDRMEGIAVKDTNELRKAITDAEKGSPT